MAAYNGGFEREAEGERKNVTVVLFAPCCATTFYTIVRVQEHDEPRFGNCRPHWFESFVVQALAKPSCAHDDTLQMW